MLRAFLLVLCAVPGLLVAQGVTVPHRAWRTITTPHFRVHHPPEMTAWAEDVAGRMEGIRTAVGAMVGYTPPQVVDIIVVDPENASNGSALPLLRGPSIRLWPTPPDPGVIGNSPDWAELVAIHEYAHLAHLLRPRRNPGSRLVSRLNPLPLAPMAIGVPAWVSEGYATVIEGRLTGAGRPNGVFRPALIRQLAIEGALPTYAGLNDAAPFQGGSMRYLVGSAFLEWLAAREGVGSYDQLWRRLTAYTDRDFPTAFLGLFGDRPDVLYGRFVAGVTAQAFAAQRELARAGIAQGTLVQKMDWYNRSPTVSPDGKQVAIWRGRPGQPAFVHLWSVEPRKETEAMRRSAERAAKRDSLDVPARSPYPVAREQVAELAPRDGVPFEEPRFFADGRRLLVVRAETRADGESARELWIWEPASGALRQVTRAAAIRIADPFPDGSRAAGVRCRGGRCDLVRIDLGTGLVTKLAEGSFTTPFTGVRVSPDGKRIASARLEGGVWRVVIVDAASGDIRTMGPRDAAHRYDPAWLADGSGLVVVSEASGIPQLERIDPDGGTAPITRTTGMASRPDVAKDGRIWYVDFHARGWDLRALAPDSVARGAAVLLADSLAPVASRIRAGERQTFPASPVTSRAYGAGPLFFSWIPIGSSSAEGSDQAGMIHATDPLGRFGAVLQGGMGVPAVWRGGNLAVTWRGLRPSLTASGWAARHLPSRQSQGPLASTVLDAEYRGAALKGDLAFAGTGRALEFSGGVSQGRLAAVPSGAGNSGDRTLAVASATSRLTFTPGGKLRIAPELRVQGAAGRTLDASWTRTVIEGRVAVGNWLGNGLRASGMMGGASASAPAYEQFSLGGAPSPYVDGIFLGQRWASPSLPFATVGGRRAFRARAELVNPVLTPFYEWNHAGESVNDAMRRVAGVEASFDVPPVPGFRLPASMVQFGVGFPVDGPRRHQPTWFATLVITP